LSSQIIIAPRRPVWLVVAAGSTIGLCIVGDSLLYSVLPLAAPELGISLTQVGILLSANRLVRLATNGWAAAFFERWGPYPSFLLACIIGLISTALYGINYGFALFLLARLLWGTAWSGLRQGGYQAVWTGDAASKGRLTGLLWGLVRLGSALSVLAGGLLYDQYGFATTIAVMVGVTFLSVVVAWLIAWPVAVTAKGRPALPRATLRERSSWRDGIKTLDSASRRWLTAAGALQLLLSGVVISTTSLFLANLQSSGNHALILGLGIGASTGVLQGVRWLSDITIGPTIGYLSDHIGQHNAALGLVLLSFASLAGVALLEPTVGIYCLFLVFLCDSGLSITLSAAASGAAHGVDRPHLFVGIYTTAGDAGSAIGPLFAYSVGQALGLPTLYLTISLALVIVLARYRWLVNRGQAVISKQ
jgi:MFS family permease